MRLPLVVLANLLAVSLLAACGGAGVVDRPVGADPSITGPTSSPTDGPTPGPTTDPATELPDDRLPADPSGKRGEVRTLTGVLVTGEEAGCLLLEDGGRRWLLLGPDVAGARPGTRVVVVGTPSPSTMTTCQQGTPFVVTRLAPAQD